MNLEPETIFFIIMFNLLKIYFHLLPCKKASKRKEKQQYSRAVHKKLFKGNDGKSLYKNVFKKTQTQDILVFLLQAKIQLKDLILPVENKGIHFPPPACSLNIYLRKLVSAFSCLKCV